MALLGGHVEQVASQMTDLTALSVSTNSSASPVPRATREPYIPIPSKYFVDLGTCGQFLRQCSLVFDQKPETTTRINLRSLLS